MNKRKKRKRTKINNTKRIDLILNEISKEYEIENVTYTDGYYIFDFGKNSVCHFNLKEIPNWYWCIWLGKNNYKIFGEHKDLIDKFKPSYTYISESDVGEFLHEIKPMKDNLKLYFVDSLTNRNALVAYEKDYDYDYVFGYQTIHNYNEETNKHEYTRDFSITQEYFVNKKYNEFFEEKKEKFKNIEKDRKFVFNYFKEFPNMFEGIMAIGIDDESKGHFRTYPRYDICIVVEDYMAKNNFKLFDEIESDIIKSKKEHLRKLITSEHEFDFGSVTNSFDDIKKCDRIFMNNKYSQNKHFAK